MSMTIIWRIKLERFLIHCRTMIKQSIGNSLQKALTTNIRNNCIVTIGCLFKGKLTKTYMMRSMFSLGKKCIPTGLPRTPNRMENRTNSNGINFRYLHVSWGKQNHSSISSPLPTLLLYGFLFSSYTLQNTPTICPCTNMPEKTIFY